MVISAVTAREQNQSRKLMESMDVM
jgi:hypothetical protein